ncbi:MAG: DnaD domain protein [Clostridia bacterium]|nr:DnaD domain protein [Bacilli bacterium]MBR2705455.1 DnaD domain protein [Clostridia bacterium]
MKLEQNDLSLLFSTTSLPDVFFTEYLSQLSGDCVKIYMYMSFLAKYNKEIKLNDLSKKLNIPLKTIQDSIKLLEDEQVITKKNTGYIVNNLQEIELHKLYNPKVTSSPEEIEKIAQNKYRAKAIENINNEFFQGMMSPSWYSDIDLWFKKYSFDEEVMNALFRYCFNRSALHRNYIQTVAEAWFQNNIRTFNDLDKYYEKQEKLNTLQKNISKKLGITRNLTQYEEGYIEKWNMDFGYNLDVIEIALKKTTSKANPNFEYLDKLLTDWHDRSLKTSNDVQSFLTQMKEKTKNIKTLEKNTGYSNYDQRNYNDLNSFYTN